MLAFCLDKILFHNKIGSKMLVSEFMSLFIQRLYETMPEDAKRDLIKQDRTVKHALYLVMGKYQRLSKDLASPFQEKFHLRMDQLAADYRTWKNAGCKSYARPKQYISGQIAGVSKKAFDYTLGSYLLDVRHKSAEQVALNVEVIESENSWDQLSEEAS